MRLVNEQQELAQKSEPTGSPFKSRKALAATPLKHPIPQHNSQC